MRLKERRKSKYPRLRPGEDQESIIAGEDGQEGAQGRCPSGQVEVGRCPTVEVGRCPAGQVEVGRCPAGQVEGDSPAAPAPSPDRTAGGKKDRLGRKKEPTAKNVHFASLPDKYEPLVEGGGEREGKAERKYKRKQRAKKYAKNFGKALQTGCRYLFIGFQGLANAYAAPWGLSSTVVAAAMSR